MHLPITSCLLCLLCSTYSDVPLTHSHSWHTHVHTCTHTGERTRRIRACLLCELIIKPTLLSCSSIYCPAIANVNCVTSRRYICCVTNNSWRERSLVFCLFSWVAWPSGLRRWIKAPVSSGAWVRIPPLPRILFSCTVPHKEATTSLKSFPHTDLCEQTLIQPQSLRDKALLKELFSVCCTAKRLVSLEVELGGPPVGIFLL